MIRFLVYLIWVLALMTSGCGLGASRLKNERNYYNQAIQQTNDEQLLLNLVRLKYRDTPFFMEVSSVTAQFTYTAIADASVSVPEGMAGTFGFGAGVTVQEKPTVSYSPLQGEKFIQRVLSPLSLETIALLYHSGWRVDRLFSICLDRLDGIKNAPTATGPTPNKAPQYEDFVELLQIFNKINQKDLMELDFQIHEGLPSLVIQFDLETVDDAEMKKLEGLLGKPHREGKLYLAATLAPDFVRIETRSLLGVMYYLSQGIDIPQDHVAEGRVTLTRDTMGKVFDWKKLTGDLMQIHSSKNRPDSAAIAIRHRGLWFYIDDTDLSSKSTFSLLAQIFSLQAGKIASTAPLLTIPIGQ
jgi:hypothetical protein